MSWSMANCVILKKAPTVYPRRTATPSGRWVAAAQTPACSTAAASAMSGVAPSCGRRSASRATSGCASVIALRRAACHAAAYRSASASCVATASARSSSSTPTSMVSRSARACAEWPMRSNAGVTSQPARPGLESACAPPGWLERNFVTS